MLLTLSALSLSLSTVSHRDDHIGDPQEAMSDRYYAAVDGTYLLDTGETVTGGYFVENGIGYYSFLDTEKLDKGGFFSEIEVGKGSSSDGQSIRFDDWKDGFYQHIEWTTKEGDKLSGHRVVSHRQVPAHFTSKDGTQLNGRLLEPVCKTSAKRPLIIVIPGSNKANRYGGPFHLFFVKLGFTVLVYDKRGYDAEQWSEPDLSSMSEDLVAAFEFASGLESVDASRMGVLGNSQGGWVVPPAAAARPDLVKFMMLRRGSAATYCDCFTRSS